MNDSPMTPGDLMRRLGMTPRTFQRHQRAGDFKKFELAQPMGIYRYARPLVDKFLSGESVVAFGRGARKARQVSA